MRVIVIEDDDWMVGKMAGESDEVLILVGDVRDSAIRRAQAAYG